MDSAFGELELKVYSYLSCMFKYSTFDKVAEQQDCVTLLVVSGIIKGSVAESPHLAVGKNARMKFRKAGSMTPLIRSEQVDPLTIREWIKFCKSHHDKSCQHRSDRPKNLRVIDCNTSAVVPISDSNPFLALS